MVRSVFASFQRPLSRARDLPRTLRLVWDAAHLWTVAWAALLLAQGGLPAATVYLTRWLVDTLVAVHSRGFALHSFRTLLAPGGLLAGVMLLTELLGAISGWVRANQS